MELTQPDSDQIRPLQVDSLIWSQPQQNNNNGQSPFNIFTATKSLKSAYFFSHIKPDYGSLGEFMKDVGISKDILMHNRKKKLDQQEDLEQKKMRATLKGKPLQKIIRQQGSTLEKITASKMIVQNLFQKNFGNTISNFCSQNNRQDSSKVNYSSINELADILDQLMTKEQEQDSIQGSFKEELPVLSRNKNQMSSKDIKMIGIREKVEKVRQIKAFYPSLKKYKAEVNQDQPLNIRSVKVLQINQNNSTFPLLLEQIKQIKVEDIRVLKVSSAPLADDLLCFILDFFIQIRTCNISQLIIQNTKFANVERVSCKVREFVEKVNINRMVLDKIGLKSKDFCIICLGIGTRSSFQYLSLRYNQIGQLAIKCLDVLMKFHKNTEFDFTGNPIQKQLKAKPVYKRCLVSRQAK